MIYTDDQAADQLNSLSDQQIVDTFQDQINTIYFSDQQTKINISKFLLRTIKAYWKNAFEVLLPHYYLEYPAIKQTIPFTITSLPLPQDQAWMNGHLYDI